MLYIKQFSTQEIDLDIKRKVFYFHFKAKYKKMLMYRWMQRLILRCLLLDSTQLIYRLIWLLSPVVCNLQRPYSSFLVFSIFDELLPHNCTILAAEPVDFSERLKFFSIWSTGTGRTKWGPSLSSLDVAGATVVVRFAAVVPALLLAVAAVTATSRFVLDVVVAIGVFTETGLEVELLPVVLLGCSVVVEGWLRRNAGWFAAVVVDALESDSTERFGLFLVVCSVSVLGLVEVVASFFATSMLSFTPDAGTFWMWLSVVEEDAEESSFNSVGFGSLATSGLMGEGRDNLGWSSTGKARQLAARNANRQSFKRNKRKTHELDYVAFNLNDRHYLQF